VSAPTTFTNEATNTTVYVSIPTGPRVRGRVKEVQGTVAMPDAVHPGRPHRWHEMLHHGERGTGFAECLCGAVGVPYRRPTP
jgi:hypothetical protein